MEEFWKPIEGYENVYEISNLGNARSLNRYIEQKSIKGNTYVKYIKGRELSLLDNGLGYLQVCLSKDGIKTRKYVHVLVASSFLPIKNTVDFQEINHKDHNKSNNNILNLEYVTKSENHKKRVEFYNNKKEYKCVDCNIPVSGIKATRCVKCSRTQSRKVKNRPSKEELYELLKYNTFIQVGKIFNVSDNTIRKWLLKE